jgi:hypothetical protein
MKAFFPTPPGARGTRGQFQNLGMREFYATSTLSLKQECLYITGSIKYEIYLVVKFMEVEQFLKLDCTVDHLET